MNVDNSLRILGFDIGFASENFSLTFDISEPGRLVRVVESEHEQTHNINEEKNGYDQLQAVKNVSETLAESRLY